jgi:glucan biosynthesis protein C
VIFPLVMSGFVFANTGGGSAGFQAAIRALTSAPYTNASTAHLWFLYYLVIFCVAAVLVAPLLDRLLSDQFRRRALEVFARIVPTPTGCLSLGVVMALTLLPMTGPALETNVTFVPAARVLFAYGVFFSVGWLMFLRREVVASFGRRPWGYFSAGLVMSFVYMLAILKPLTGDPVLNFLLGISAAGIATWLLIYGIIGIFVNYFEAPRPVQRYLSDASYWMYLIHLPFAIWLPGLLAPLVLPAILKFLIVICIMTVVTVTTYHVFVRSTAIGAFLNGRRFARTLPHVNPAPPSPAAATD